jgi:hypothetical protein
LATDYNAERKHHDQTDHHVVAIALDVMEEPEDPDLNHHVAATALGMVAEVDDLDHRDGHMTIHAKETPETQLRKHGLTNHATSGMSTTMKTKKLRW